MSVHLGGGLVVVVEPPALGRTVVVEPPASSSTLTLVPVPGLTGKQGPPGASGSGVLHAQLSPAATWTIPHVFDRPPSVQLLVDDAVVYTDVQHLPGVVVVTFPAPRSGLAVLT